MIGRVLIKELEPKHELRLVDRVPPEEATMFVPGGTRAKAPFKTDWPFIVAEIMDEPAMRKAVQGVDAVVHLAAAVTGLPEFGTDTMNRNVVGTWIMLDACRLAGVPRFTCASSVNAFGTIYWRMSGKPPVYTKMPLDESYYPQPEDSYSLSKWFNEETCAAFHRAFGLTTAAFRFAGVWSEEMYQKRLEEGFQPTTKWSDDLYQWVHIKDIAAGIRQCVEAPALPGHGVYYLGAADTRCPEPSMEILRTYRPDLAATVETPLEGRASLISIDRAHRAFGYAPQYRLGSM